MQRVLDSEHLTSKDVPPMTQATYYFRFYVARALQHAEMGDRYIAELGPWRQMISLGLTTWAEQPEETRSDSHAWSSHPNFDFLNLVAGIQPASLGFHSARIEPRLGLLHHVTASYPHPLGAITVEYTHDGGRLDAKIHLPSGLPGTFVWQGLSHTIANGELDLSVNDSEQ